MQYPNSALSLSRENTNGLVVWWGFEDGTAIDLSGFGNPGVVTLAPVVVDGIASSNGALGSALQFNGSSNYVVSSKLFNTVKVTMSVWIKVNGIPSTQGLIATFMNGLNNGSQDKQLALRTITGTVAWYVFSGGDVLVIGTSNVADNRIHHICGVMDGTNAILYVDGVQEASLPAATSVTSYSVPNIFLNGTANAGVSTYLPGIMDDFRVYNRGLTPAEVNELYKRGAAANPYEWEMPTTSPSGPRAYRFNVEQNASIPITRMINY